MLNDSRNVIETLLGKIEVMKNWYCGYYEEILWSFFEIISVKLKKNYEGILENLWKNIGNRLRKLKKKHFVGSFVKFFRQFLELAKNCTGTSNNFREKSQRNPGKKFQKYLWHFLKSV